MCLMYTKCIPNFWEISMEDAGWDTLTMGKFSTGEARSDGAAQLVAASMLPVDGPGAAAALEQLIEMVCWPAAAASTGAAGRRRVILEQVSSRRKLRSPPAIARGGGRSAAACCSFDDAAAATLSGRLAGWLDAGDGM